MYSILLIDDHQVVRNGVKAILIGNPQYKVVAEASSGEEAKEALNKANIDIAFVDLRLPDCNGALLIQDLIKLSPGLKCILLTAEPNAADLTRALNGGALGCLTKEVDSSEYFKALEKVVNNQKFVSETFASFLVNKPLDYSARELEVLQLFSDGLSYKEIAAKLDISSRTVESHKLNILRKMDVKTVVEMVRFGIRNGLISP